MDVKCEVVLIVIITWMHSSYFWQLGASQESPGKQMRKLYDVHWCSVIAMRPTEI